MKLRLEYKAKNQEESSLGDLILETIDSNNKTSYLINLIASTIKREFYFDVSRGPIKAFRTALLKANSVLSDFEDNIELKVHAFTPQGTLSCINKNNKFGKIKIDASKKKSIKKIKPIKKIKLPKVPKINKKIILSAYSILIIILLLNIIIPKLNTENSQEPDLLANILEKINQAEAVLLFDEKEKARSFLEEAEKMAENINNQEVKNNISHQLDKANSIERLNNLEVIMLDFEPKKIAGQRDRIYIMGSDNASYQLSESKFIPSEPFDFNAKYSNYAYTLKDGQILKQGNPWLKQDIDLFGAIDLAIDGSIYILFDNNIKKFWKGEEQEFVLEKISNPVSEPKDIYTSLENDYIYILEKNRILVYNKKGQLIVQYLSPQFIDLKSIYVTSQDEVIYAINNNEVLRIKLSL